MKTLLFVALLASCDMLAAPLFVVTPILGPDFVTSPSFSDFLTNAFAGLINSYTPEGPNGPAQFNALGNGATLTGGEFIETYSGGFNSWLGMANPVAPFDTEFGTALYFAVGILDDQGLATLRLEDLYVTETYLGTAYGSSAIGGVYRPTMFGVDATNSLVNSGEAATTLVKELWYIGTGFVVQLDQSNGGTPQDQLNFTAQVVRQLGDRTTMVCYSLADSAPPTNGSNCASVNIQAIPEPEPTALLGIGLIGLAIFRRYHA